MKNIKLIHGDCMEYMQMVPDKYFDLAVVDPPYGIGASKPSKKPRSRGYEHKDWDNEPANHSYFNELIRVSKNQIIFGVNFYDYKFKKSGRLVWDKLNGECDQMGCEIAYNSLNERSDIVYYMWSGMMQGVYCGKDVRKAIVQQGNKNFNEKRIHPTQKPVKLYSWILNEYADPSLKIIDTHLGSGSHVIAAYDFGIKEFIGIEIDKKCLKNARQRFINHKKQLKLFN